MLQKLLLFPSILFFSSCLLLHQLGLEAPGSVASGREINSKLVGRAAGAFFHGADLFGKIGDKEGEVATAALLTGLLTQSLVGAGDGEFYTLRSARKCLSTVERGGAVIVARIFYDSHSCSVGPAPCNVESDKIIPAAMQSAFYFREHACKLEAAGDIIAFGDIQI
jgi:hypothetical protein